MFPIIFYLILFDLKLSKGIPLLLQQKRNDLDPKLSPPWPTLSHQHTVTGHVPATLFFSLPYTCHAFFCHWAFARAVPSA